MYMYIGAITIVIAGLLITSTTSMGAGISAIRSNQPPVAVDDHPQRVCPYCSNTKIYVLLNDYDPEGDTITIVSVTQPSHGVVSIEGNHVLYTPTTGYVGTDSFTYTINDGFPIPTHFVTATVYLTVGPTIDHCHDPSHYPVLIPIDGEVTPIPI
ncbi:MAG: Ig-like domain-containing protein [Euryarchaeota archaeon]|nr:Ig-like domain-containing protein [Euryarchaeota archaeon]